MKYIGVKEVSAVPMSYNEAVEKGYRVSGDTVATEGYEVEYEGGYKSWSPKDVFEKAYTETGLKFVIPNVTEDYKVRVIDEVTELSLKISKLDSFLKGDVSSVKEDEQLRLKKQLLAMQSYQAVLLERISNFNK